MAGERSAVVSSFTSIKGTLVEETLAAFRHWDFELSRKQNLDRLKHENWTGSAATTWLRDLAKVFNRRFDPAGRDRPLVTLARRGWPVEHWKPALLWHMTRDEFLLRDFLVHWLYPRYAAGALSARPEELFEYLERLPEQGGQTEHVWARSTLERVASGLLLAAADFDLLRGGMRKEFRSFHLPEPSLLYLLHAAADHEPNPRRLLDLEDWRMVLLRREDLEQELFRLHQFGKLEFHVAGSVAQLKLPFASALDFAERWVP